jgi:hypothetical protein
MHINPSMMVDLARERQREIIRQAERDRLVSQVRSEVRAARRALRAEGAHPARWRIALKPSARLQ